MDTAEPIKIAISGIGGGVGQSILKSLDQSNYSIVGLDGELLAVGLYAVPIAYKIPYAKDPLFISRLAEICASEKCELLFPGLDAELPVLSRNVDRFDKIGTKLIVSRPEVIDICDNKMLTYRFLTSNDITTPLTFELSEYLIRPSILGFPVIVKQKIGGARSQNVSILKNESHLESLLVRKEFKEEDYLVQEYIEGDEYTCGTINLDERCVGVIIMRRTLRAGDTYRCFSVRNQVIESEVRNIMDKLKPFGACNVQLRLREGKVYILEINARCSGTTAARSICGFNEPQMIADYLCHRIEPKYNISELSILRYWKEYVVENEKIKGMESNGYIHNNLLHKL